MENGWTERIAELTESRDHWKREWRLLNAGLNMAEDKIKELEAENKRLRKLLHRCLMGGVFFASDLVDEVKQALEEASHE